jgi:putative CocE/NonD family hydrolase
LQIRAVGEPLRPVSSKGASLRFSSLLLTFALTATPLSLAHAAPKSAKVEAPSFADTPAHFELVKPEANYIKRVEMIPMRDGVKLYTVIWIPKGAKGAPIILTRTPYNAAKHMRAETADLKTTLALEAEPFVENGYIRVYQDVRGKYGSEGDYVMTRPPIGPLNPTKVDHTTDAYDTIDWLVKHLPESNGKVGMIGSSYEGFTVVMALLHPHPALKAAVPESPMVDGWMGDDWFHYGAFRNPNIDYTMSQTAQRGEGKAVPREGADDYTTYLNAGSSGDYARARGLDKLPYIQKLFDHPAYDAFWQGQALDKLIVEHPSTVPTLWEQGLWDQEDMWGANHSYAALKAAGHESTNWLVMGPWFHSQINREGLNLGPLRWKGDTAMQFRREMVLPFFNQYLKDGPPANLARVTVYNDAENHWDHFATWPMACEKGCTTGMTPIYLQAGGALGFDKPAGAGGDSYVSDPAKPVIYTPRPVQFSDSNAWRTWLVHDQRFIDGRPDVMTYQTAPLTSAVKLEGAPLVDLAAMTTGTDGDFVVKLIDVYPGDYATQEGFGGYELPIGTDIFRGRYRDSFEHPTAIPANTPQHYRFALPNSDHVFLPGHRIMVMVMSSQFPLYDRNPQTFVPNIFNAKAGDYQKATVTLLRSGDNASAVWLPIVAAH